MKNKIYLQITSGRGPAECCRVVALVSGKSDSGRAGCLIIDFKRKTLCCRNCPQQRVLLLFVN